MCGPRIGPCRGSNRTPRGVGALGPGPAGDPTGFLGAWASAGASGEPLWAWGLVCSTRLCVLGFCLYASPGVPVPTVLVLVSGLPAIYVYIYIYV